MTGKRERLVLAHQSYIPLSVLDSIQFRHDIAYRSKRRLPGGEQGDIG